jgi:amino acid permease
MPDHFDLSGDIVMKIILILLGLALIAVAVVYFVVPADQLPGFFPGHEAGVTRIHGKHGIVAGVIGIVLLGVAFAMRRR